VRVLHALDRDALRCIAATADGSVLVPLERARRGSPSTTTPAINWSKPYDQSFWFPLGTRRGRVYLTCTTGQASSFLELGSDKPTIRAVWGLDV
jgi:hypothetical protein